MQDFNEFIKKDTEENKKDNQNVIDMVTKMAKQFDGKSQGELMKAVFDEAKKRKKAGRLSNEEIDGFYAMLYPMMDDKQRKMLTKIVEELKRL
jgi:hypothetical protein